MKPPEADEMEVSGDNKKRKKRRARLEVRYSLVNLMLPANLKGKGYPERQPVWVVEVKEKAETVPAKEEPIEWRLYTSHPVESPEGAEKIIKHYKSRWMIEDLFRTLKSEGVNYEETELETGKALRKLFVMAFIAAIQILQLRQARDGTTDQQVTLVFSPEEVECMEDLLPKFEGKTEKQKNPHPRNNLAWGAWMIARLGGWKGYASQRPPGVITLHDGWTRFHSIFLGWKVGRDVYKR
jgi:hypothetical protein